MQASQRQVVSKLEFEYRTIQSAGSNFGFDHKSCASFNSSTISTVLCRIIVPNFTAIGQRPVIDDLAHFHRAILGGGAFSPDGWKVLRGVWTELH